MQYQLTVELPEYSIAQLKIIPNATKVLSKVIQEAIDREAVTTKTKAQPSKWAKLADKIKNDPDLKDPKFQEAWKQMRQDMTEFRKNFSFKHDLVN